jgi:PadR family transcriptional regulator
LSNVNKSLSLDIRQDRWLQSFAEEPLLARQKQDLLQGTLDLLILQTLALEPMHGWGISQRIQQISREVLRVNQGSLYPALHRLEQQGWIEAEWDASENNRQAKYYRLTRTGRKQLLEERENWARMSDAVARILQSSET